MKKIIFSIIAVSIATTSFAAGKLKLGTCWKGYSNADQGHNLVTCMRQTYQNQKCSTNWNEHQQSFYDVCIIEVAGPMRVMSLFQGWSQQNQNASLRQCEYQKGINQVCVTDWSIHGGGVYDVALME